MKKLIGFLLLFANTNYGMCVSKYVSPIIRVCRPKFIHIDAVDWGLDQIPDSHAIWDYKRYVLLPIMLKRYSDLTTRSHTKSPTLVELLTEQNGMVNQLVQD